MLDTVVGDNRWIHGMVLFKGLLKKTSLWESYDFRRKRKWGELRTTVIL